MIEKHVLDDANFYELLLKYLVRDKVVMSRASALSVQAEDFMSSPEFGNPVYRDLADIALGIGTAPIDPAVFGMHLKNRLEAQKLDPALTEDLARLWTWFYNDEPLTNSDYFAEQLKLFVKRRREEKAKLEAASDTDLLRERLNSIAIDLSDNNLTDACIINPFSQLILPVTEDMIPTGFRKVDMVAQGLARGDYGLIVGYTGSGKTALATQMATFNCLIGNKVAFMAMEDTLSNMAMRFYSLFFSLSYSKLRNGQSNCELTSAFQSPVNAEEMKILAQNLKIFSLKGSTPCSNNQLKTLLDKEFETTGFIPDMVIGDQMQFMCPNTPKVGEGQWQTEESISAECDELSHQPIGGKNFAYWVLHQAKGKIKLRFSRDEIQGFKGIDQKADVVFCIGRDGPLSNDFLFFSNKARHVPNFEFPYKGQLEFMKFNEIDTNIANTEDQLQGRLAMGDMVTRPTS